MSEKETEKYKSGVELLILLEKDTKGLYEEEIRNMEPRDLYSYLWDEWWREWNGLIQEWKNLE